MLNGPGLTNQSVASAGVEDTADQIHELVVAELTLQETGGTLTASGAEQTLYINNNPLGCFRPHTLLVDLDNMQAGDSTVLKVYYRLAAGTGLQLTSYIICTGQDGGLSHGIKVICSDLCPNRFGIRITLEQTAGTNRDYTWEIFTEE